MAEIVGSVYEVIEKLGAGGGGVVYLANHMRLKKRVVLKADKRKLSTRPELLRREVDVLKDLSHPYIPQVYDFFTENGTVYTAMAFVDGESLDKPLKEGKRFSQPQVIRWAEQLLQALDYLHSPTHGSPPRGYVHSDIKPANLMCRLNGDICLIDFNISLAVGEMNVIGASEGYASPEHYGLDFSSSVNTATQAEMLKTVLAEDKTTPVTVTGGRTASSHKMIVPDIRSDIYSTGATLYHLLSGRRPAKDAQQVAPLSESEASRQVAAIIAKAMNPNPDLRYQTAAEMLWDFEHLHENDPRTRRLKTQRNVAAAVLTALFFVGGISTFTGLRQMQQAEAAARLIEEEARLAAEAAEAAERAAKEAEERARAALAAVGEAESALREGDVPTAVAKAIEALSLKSPYTAQAQRVLTEALGVYDLTDGFKSHLILDLPSEPLKVELSPQGTRVAVMVSGEVLVFDTETGQQIAELSSDPSALSDVVFAGENMLLYAGVGALRTHDLTDNRELWFGNAATAITLSDDGSIVAALYKDETTVTIYDTATGSVRRTVVLDAPTQKIAVNDIFTDPENDLFCLNNDGTLLAVSTVSGGLLVYDLQNSDNDLIVLDDSEYTHFEGGFSGKYLAFAANGSNESFFAVVDVPGAFLTCRSSSTMPFHIQVDESGVYLAAEDILVKVNPESGGQEEVAFTDTDITGFRKNGTYTIVATADEAFSFFGAKATLLAKHEAEGRGDFVRLTNPYAAVGSLDAPFLRVLKLENYLETQVFSYDAAYAHDEARISADGQTVMLFNYNKFRLYEMNGGILAEVTIPNADQVYDQQFRREDSGSYLDVIYNNGLVLRYSAADGSLVSETAGNKPDGFLEEFLTDKWRIVSELHGAPEVYDRENGELVQKLEIDGYLTYVTQVGDYVIVEYLTAKGERYGLLLNEDCESLAELPYLCDILEDGTLIFDDMLGNLRESRIYSLQELIALAQNDIHLEL